MAYTRMDVVPDLYGYNKFAYQMTQSLAAAGDTPSILIPAGVISVMVVAQAASGATAAVYASTDTLAVVQSGTGITWVLWDEGAITTAKSTVYSPVTALKMTQVGSGTSKISVRAV